MAKNFRESDYAKNKKRKDAIVYTYDEGAEYITLDRVNDEQPEYEQADFEFLKEKSDENLKAIDRSDTTEARYKKASFDENIQNNTTTVPSPEEQLLARMELTEKQIKVRKALATLTKTQKRRVLMLKEGLSTIKIAEIEGCNQNAIWKSIEQARTKFEKFFPEMGGRNGKKKTIR